MISENGQDTRRRSGFADLTDRELGDRMREHKENADLDAEIKPDLEQLQRDQRAEHRKSRYDGMNWLERTVKQAKELFTGGPEAQYRSMVREAENTYASIKQRNDNIETVLDEKSRQISSFDARLEDTQVYAETALEQYKRSTHRRERFEEELDQLKESGQYTPQLREKREQVRVVRKEQRELYRETSTAMNALRRFETQRAKVEQQYESLSARLSKHREQEDSLHLKLHDWRMEQELRFPERGKSARELYEKAGILDQQITRFIEDELPRYEDPDVREEYGIGMDVKSDNPALKEWKNTPSP